ncbi:RNA-directed DNA polymerase, eukaryota, reverse transcriptase zinc-binding domain protein [Tanacetum coccineum]
MGKIINTKLCLEEARDMVADVTDKEIKADIFDIDSNKSPGPYRFSACFFKKAWDIISRDVCKAVKEFFYNGKLLGEVNATLIALVPKCPVPLKVSEFRPIACCNVIYKYISKIITNRIKDGLTKIISCNQSAFVPGRHIQDNILITQELLKGCNRRNGAKRVSHGYFKGDREIKLTHLCFADDLLVVCNGDKDSLEVVKSALKEFSMVSGLFPNLSKSTIFFGSINEKERSELLKVLPFQCGKLPMKYLGVPLLAKRLGIKDCKSLVDKVASVYLLPYGVIKDIEKVLKRFLWSLRALKEWNETLLVKQLWNVIADKESLWVKWVNVVKLKQKSIWEISLNANDSWGWKNMLELRDKIKEYVIYRVRNGKKISIWHDKWCEQGPLINIISYRSIYDARLKPNATVSDMINMEDNVLWLKRDGNPIPYSTKAVWKDLRVMNKLFKSESRTKVDLCCVIKENIKNKLMSLRVKRSSEIMRIAEVWGLKWSNI